MDTNTTTPEPVQDADVVEAEDTTLTPPAVPTDANAAQVLIDLENLIKSHITGIDTRKDELKKQKEMLNDIFNNDSNYRELDKKVKEANKVKSAHRAQLARQPNAIGLSEKVKTLTAEVKEMEGALSDYLREYGRMSGVNEIEGDDGEMREIIFIAKLIKKSSLQKK